MVFLLCWNVAGLSTVVRRIHTNYGSSSNPKGNQCPALAQYVERHGAPDIVCFQEHKIPKTQLSNRSEPQGCAIVEGYESFWSCCCDEKSKGMNGVVTYAKKGTVVSANATPFGDASLDDQGRCVMTDHGNFVVFNVYVPCSGGHPMSEKMRFLQALRRSMKKQRQVHQKAVILTGDLNISYHKRDVCWNDQVLHVNDILKQVQESNNNTQPEKIIPEWKLQLAKAWPIIVEALKTKKAVPQQTQNPTTGATFDRYRLTITMGNPTRTIPLGKPQAEAGMCFYGYDFAESCHYEDPETGEFVLAATANVVPLYILQELMTEIAKIEWNDAILREIAESPDAGRSRVHPPRQWLTNMMQEDDMVDSFRHFYPTARDRFTCWHQYTNTRYSNEGARIDFVLVDRSLLPFLQRGSPLRTGEGINESITTSNDIDPLSEEAALAAATARGQFQAAPFQGGGIIEPTQRALDTQFGPRHTGIIYTPPSFSDHAAVSLLLGEDEDELHDEEDTAANHPKKCWRAEDWGKLVLNEKDSDTKRAQPHKAQKTIASFFTAGASTKTISTAAKKPTLPQKRPATVKSFFQPKGSSSGSQNVAPAGTQTSRIKGKSSSNLGGKITNTGVPTKKKMKTGAPSILNHFAKK